LTPTQDIDKFEPNRQSTFQDISLSDSSNGGCVLHLEGKGLRRVSGQWFRIGGTTFYLVSGVEPHIIKKFGRWRSEAFLEYWRCLDQLGVIQNFDQNVCLLGTSAMCGDCIQCSHYPFRHFFVTFLLSDRPLCCLSS
jgi:hypothetical protein